MEQIQQWQEWGVEYESENEWDKVNSDMDGSMFYEDYSRSDDKDMEIFEEFKNEEQIDEVAAKIRKISPKFEDLKRLDIFHTMKWLEYEIEVRRIASLPENFCTVMPLREEEQVI